MGVAVAVAAAYLEIAFGQIKDGSVGDAHRVVAARPPPGPEAVILSDAEDLGEFDADIAQRIADRGELGAVLNAGEESGAGKVGDLEGAFRVAPFDGGLAVGDRIIDVRQIEFPATVDCEIG